MESLSISAANVPKMSLPTLEVRKNYYVVPDGRQFHYFPIKVIDDANRPIIRFEKRPPVVMEGIGIVGKKLYWVPVQDLTRGIIRRFREITPAKRARDGSSGNTAITRTSTGPSGENPAVNRSDVDLTSSDRIQRRSSTDPGLEINQAADVAWEEQIDTLLSLLSEKEGGEWELSGPAQS